ncbi:MAG: DUF362 domain-containing protein [Deltaproteobacteria bacterium]|nr:DUF362 domain-containing protein [Deltaproteobacteria bacterium]
MSDNRAATVAVIEDEDKFLALKKVLDETGFFHVLERRFSESNKTKDKFLIAIKPNFMFMYSKNDISTYTDPELVEYLIDRIHKQGFSNIVVVEAQSTYGNYFKNREVRKVAEYIGYSEKNYRIIDLTEESVSYEFGGRLGTHPVGPTWKDADFRISFAKNKTHTFCYYTLTIKNVYGALAMQNKLKEYHTKREIYWPAIEMLKHFPVHYGLIDAYISADGQFGIFADRYPNLTKTIIGGENLIAVDWVGAKKMGIDPMASRYMKLAVAAFGMPEINWIGDRTEYTSWRNVKSELVETVDRIEELYSFSNTLFMAINDMDPYFIPKRRTLFIKLLRRLFKPIRDLIMRERVDINSLRLMELDPNKEVRIFKQVFLIKAERTRVYRYFLENFEVLLPETLQITRKVTPGPVRVGTRYTAIPNFLTRPMVNVEITSIKEGEELVYGYLEGSPFSGRNSIVFKDNSLGTDIEVALHYQIIGIASWFGWYLLGGKRFHKRLVVEGFRNLKVLLEEKN